MKKNALVAVRMVLVTLFVTGIVYPLVVTVLAQAIFPKQANGSLVSKRNRVIGSALIGQQFTKPEYFHPRPSAAGNGYDPLASGGSNLGPTSKLLLSTVNDNISRVRKENPGLKLGDIPADMVTASASGLDPHISVENAYLQVPRVAKARGISESEVENLVPKNTEDRQFGLLGEPRVNVLLLNLALDQRL